MPKQSEYKITVIGTLVSEFIGVRGNDSDTAYIIDHIPTGMKVAQCLNRGVAIEAAKAVSEWCDQHRLSLDDTANVQKAFPQQLQSYLADAQSSLVVVSFGEWCSNRGIAPSDLK